MSIEATWKNFFKPEVINAGSVLVAKKLIFLQQSSDTQVNALVRATGSVKVRLQSESISSDQVLAHCSCPSFARGQLCKHIWGTLLLLGEKTADFLACKTKIESDMSAYSNLSSNGNSSGNSSDSKVDSKALYKAKQAAYRKEVYESQKKRKKELKSKISRVNPRSKTNYKVTLTEDAQVALKYFEQNGFPMNEPFSEVDINHAKKVLSKIFHADRGGSHEEMVDLLKHASILLDLV